MKLKYFLGIVAALIVQCGVVWAQGPEMNKVYTVPMENFSGNNSFQIPPSAFLADATSAVVTVKDFGSWGILRKGAFTSDNFASNVYGVLSVSYEFSGADLEVALNGNLYINCDANANTTVTVLNKDANYVAPSPGPGGNGGGGTDNPDPDYEPDYSFQQDTDGDGVLEPCAEFPAFGALIDYNIYPQKTNLPTIYITTEETLDYKNKTSTYYTSTIVVVDKHGKMKQRNETVGLRGRGNSTWRSSSKKPWRLKFPEKTKFLAEQDENFNAINNYANAKSWTLLANDFDKSMIRNALTHELVDYINDVDKANNLPFVPAYRFVDLVLNGEYWGTYQVSDQVQVDKNRINIDADGWFVEYTINNNGFVEEPFIKIGISYVNIKNPEDETAAIGDPNSTAAVNDGQQTQNPIYDEMKNMLNALHTAIANKNYKTGDIWRNYVDLESLVDWVIAMDITGNFDGGIANDYVYKSSTEDKLHFGPLWDLDLAYGNYDDSMTKGKHFWQGNGHEYSGIAGSMNNIYDDPYFVKALYERWQSIYKEGALTTYMLDKVANLSELIDESQQLNYSEAGHAESQWWTNKWTLNENGLGAKTYNTYAAAVATITDFIGNHNDWLNTEYATQYANLGCATLNPCADFDHNDGYVLQDDGSYRKGCDVCGTLSTTDEQTYYQFTVYPESKNTETIMATSWHPSKDKPNSIAVVEAKQKVVEKIEGWNIIAGKKNAEGNLTCKDFRLTDGHPYYGDNKFVATNATYTRSITDRVGTVCLPFKQQSATINGAKLYHLNSVSSEELVLKIIEPEIEGNASAYVPVVFVAEEDISELTFTGENVTVKKISALEPYYPMADNTDWSFVGTMEQTVFDDVSVLKDENGAQQYLYYLSGDKLYRATKKFTCTPFRAYFLSDTNLFSKSAQSHARLRIVTQDELGIQNIINDDQNWDNAIHVSSLVLPLPTGKYIINGRNVIINE